MNLKDFSGWQKLASLDGDILHNGGSNILEDYEDDVRKKLVVGRTKRWSIFQNIFTNGGKVYNRQNVAFGMKSCILKSLDDVYFQVQSLWDD